MREATVVSKKEHKRLLDAYDHKCKQVEYLKAKLTIIEFEKYEEDRNKLPY